MWGSRLTTCMRPSKSMTNSSPPVTPRKKLQISFQRAVSGLVKVDHRLVSLLGASQLQHKSSDALCAGRLCGQTRSQLHGRQPGIYPCSTGLACRRKRCFLSFWADFHCQALSAGSSPNHLGQAIRPRTGLCSLSIGPYLGPQREQKGPIVRP